MMMRLLNGSVAHNFCYKLSTPRGWNHNELNSLALCTKENGTSHSRHVGHVRMYRKPNARDSSCEKDKKSSTIIPIRYLINLVQTILKTEAPCPPRAMIPLK